MQTLHFYIHFASKPEAIVSSPQEYDDLLRHVIHMLDRADCERGSMLSISEENAQEFISNLGALKEFDEFYGTYSSAEAIGLILQELSVENWRDKQLHNTDEWKTFYRYFSATDRNISDDCPEILKETAERIALNLQQNEDRVVILDIGKSFPNVNHISVIRGVEQAEPEMININKVSSFSDLENWIYSNTPARRYNHHDNRHIENHPDYLWGKSPILGGIGGKQNLATLLERALGDAREKYFLINEDLGYGTYVRYEYEHVEHENQYHGYHLVKPATHEIDVKAVAQIPPRIKKLLAFRRSQQ